MAIDIGGNEQHDLYAFDLETSEFFEVTRSQGENYPGEFSPDNKKMLVLSTCEKQMNLYILDWERKEIKKLTDFDNPVKGGLWTKDGEWMPELYEVNTGKRLDLNLPRGVYFWGQFAHKNKIFLMHSDPTHRERMLLYDIEKGTYEVIQEAEYGSINPSDFSDAECIKYNSKDGTEIEAILYKLKGIKHGEKVPAVVFVQGGPRAQDLLEFNIYAQCIASLGFAVLQPNFRGSFGYGKKFAEALIKDWGGKEAEDIAWGVEYLKKLDWIDQDRIAVVGGSYGGYASYWQMVKYPELWKAGVAWIGVTDLLKMYEESQLHFKYFLREYMGDPEKDRELWIDRSPVTHAKNFKGPLLMIQGVNDPRCPVSQARIFRDKLIGLGFRESKDFEYHELGEEGHGSLDKEQRVKTFKLMTGFLKRRLI